MPLYPSAIRYCTLVGFFLFSVDASSQQKRTPDLPTAHMSDPSLESMPSEAPPAQTLQLEVYVNGVRTGLIATFLQANDRSLSVTAGELTELGIRPPKGANAEDRVELNRLAGLSYGLIAEKQEIRFTATDAARLPKVIDAGPQRDRQKATASTGAILNYSLFSSTGDFLDKDFEPFRGISGGFEGRMFSRLGTLTQSFTANLSDGDLDGLKRLNTLWSYSDQDRLITYRAGDLVTNGLSWTRPVYLGGLQVSRNFSLRSDLVTMPMPGFTGTAAVPSTLEIYTRNARTFSTEIPAGPFMVTNLPAYTGNGEATVVIRDTLGRETRTTHPFYNTADMLRQGLLDFSVEAGYPRRNFGTESNDYYGDPFGSATVRYGASSGLTLESHVEGGADLINGGLGAVFSVGGLGVLSLAAAGSRRGEDTGMLASGAVQATWGAYSVYGKVQQSFGDYDDIASVSADYDDDENPYRYYYTGYTQFYSPRVPKTLVQASVGVPTPFERSSLNLSYTYVRTDDGDRSNIAGVSYSQSFFKNTSFYVSAFKDLDREDSFGVFAGISISFDDGINFNSGVERSPDGFAVATGISKSETREEGSVGWNIRDREGHSANRSASASYRSRYGRIEGQVNQSDRRLEGNLWLDGAFAVAGGGVFATNRIDDAFAVVNVGAPNVEVRSSNRAIGRTDGSGRIIVPDLGSYRENRIDIDTSDLPVDAVTDSTRTVVVPAQQSGVVVDFGVKANAEAAIVSFIGPDGKPLDPGTIGNMNGADEAFVVGYDGQAFIQGLKPQNSAVLRLDSGPCTAWFGYKARPGIQVTVRDVVCR
jgi:outer membrane usher protein